MYPMCEPGDDDAGLKPGQGRTEAEMATQAERQMSVGTTWLETAWGGEDWGRGWRPR